MSHLIILAQFSLQLPAAESFVDIYVAKLIPLNYQHDALERFEIPYLPFRRKRRIILRVYLRIKTEESDILSKNEACFCYTIYLQTLTFFPPWFNFLLLHFHTPR